MTCRNCGEPVAPERADAGYDYCRRESCIRACARGVTLAAVAVNKSNDAITVYEAPPPGARAGAPDGAVGHARRDGVGRLYVPPADTVIRAEFEAAVTALRRLHLPPAEFKARAVALWSAASARLRRANALDRHLPKQWEQR
jgi:hypothetical protein